MHVAGSEPKLLPEEEPPGMGNFPIVMEDKSVTIDQSSRLNFGKVYTVEHNVKIRNVGKISKESIPRLKAALLKSMGINASDLDTETGTETEDNVSRPTQIESQPKLHSADKRSSSSSQSQPQKRRLMRQSQFFISGEGIDREVITTDICRYLGNDALVKPGIHKVCHLMKSHPYAFVIAERPRRIDSLDEFKKVSTSLPIGLLPQYVCTAVLCLGHVSN